MVVRFAQFFVESLRMNILEQITGPPEEKKRPFWNGGFWGVHDWNSVSFASVI